jgi:hypothetical protein
VTSSRVLRDVIYAERYIFIFGDEADFGLVSVAALIVVAERRDLTQIVSLRPPVTYVMRAWASGIPSSSIYTPAVTATYTADAVLAQRLLCTSRRRTQPLRFRTIALERLK